MALEPWAAGWWLERRISSQVTNKRVTVVQVAEPDVDEPDVDEGRRLHVPMYGMNIWLFDAPSGLKQLVHGKLLGFQSDDFTVTNSIGRLDCQESAWIHSQLGSTHGAAPPISSLWVW